MLIEMLEAGAVEAGLLANRRSTFPDAADVRVTIKCCPLVPHPRQRQLDRINRKMDQPMRTRHTTFLLAASLIAIALTAGCTSDPKVTGTSGTETLTPTATPTPTLSEEDQAAADAETAYREWQQVRTSCLTDPANTVSSCFDEVAIGDQLTSDYSSLDHYQREGWHVVGDTKVVSIELVSVDLTDRVDRPADPARGISEVRTVPKVTFRACLDASDYDLVDAAGESHLGPNFSRLRRVSVEVVNYNYPDPAQWLVWDAYKDSEVTQSCDS